MSQIDDDLAFEGRYSAGRPFLWSETVIADLDTPVSAYLKLATDEAYACLLESVEGGETRGRYSTIGLAPDLIVQLSQNGATLSYPDTETPDEVKDGAPLDILRAVLADSHIDLDPETPPMAAALAGYLGYDCVQQMEALRYSNPQALDVPMAMFMRPTIMAVFDSVKNHVTLFTPVRPTRKTDWQAAYRGAQARLQQARDKLDAPLMDVQGAAVAAPLQGQNEAPVKSNTPRAHYLDMVEKAQDYILSGDIFQVVLSQKFTQDYDLAPFSLYRALRRTNPSPYMYYFRMGGFSIVGSSPEILVGKRGDRITIRPIAGTYARGKTRDLDRQNAEKLLADPKECAEHLMLLDLGRNDVGRVAQAGSVKVTEQFVIERYSHVMHIVSNVEGRLKPDLDALDALCAGFPAGTLSGAPKIRAMEIIEELEVAARGPYGGGVGYFSAGGDMDIAILLRTAIVKDGKIHVQAGAGVVADSVAESEQQECENKAAALFAAAKEARRFAAANQS